MISLNWIVEEVFANHHQNWYYMIRYARFPASLSTFSAKYLAFVFADLVWAIVTRVEATIVVSLTSQTNHSATIKYYKVAGSFIQSSFGRTC